MASVTTNHQHVQQAQVFNCEFDGFRNVNDTCLFEGVLEKEVYYMTNYQRCNPYSNTYNSRWKNQSKFRWINKKKSRIKEANNNLINNNKRGNRILLKILWRIVALDNNIKININNTL